MHRTCKKDASGPKQGTDCAQYNSHIWREAHKQFRKHLGCWISTAKSAKVGFFCSQGISEKREIILVVYHPSLCMLGG